MMEVFLTALVPFGVGAETRVGKAVAGQDPGDEPFHPLIKWERIFRLRGKRRVAAYVDGTVIIVIQKSKST